MLRERKTRTRITDAGMMRRDFWERRVMRRIIFGICVMMIGGAVCRAQQTDVTSPPNGFAASDQAASSPELDALASQIAQQIEKKHLKSVLVIGAVGPDTEKLTQDGQEIGDQVSVALAKKANGFQVVDRGGLRDFLKRNGISETMTVSDALANWLARKTGMGGYVVVQIVSAANGRVSIAASVYKKGQDEGDLQKTFKTELELTVKEKRDGLRPLDSDWNKPTYSKEELGQIPVSRQAACMQCPYPQFTEEARHQGPGISETATIFVTVSADGRVSDIAVAKPARFGLNASAVEAILYLWRFKPGLDAQGKAVTTRFPVEITFSDR